MIIGKFAIESDFFIKTPLKLPKLYKTKRDKSVTLLGNFKKKTKNFEKKLEIR